MRMIENPKNRIGIEIENVVMMTKEVSHFQSFNTHAIIRL